MKPFLILQLRPEDEASDGEFRAILKSGNLEISQTHRVRMEKDGIPNVDLDDYSGVIVGGGPTNVSSKNKSPAEKHFEGQLYDLLGEIIKRDFPYLGACYGLSVLSQHLGGTVSTKKYAETVAATTIEITKEARDDPILHDFPDKFRAVGGHKESCQDLPKGAVLLASTKKCPIHMIRYRKNIYATQFHPELDSNGTALRIRVYRHHGYFKPDEADQLIADVMKETLSVPGMILERFITRYQTVAG